MMYSCSVVSRCGPRGLLAPLQASRAMATMKPITQDEHLTGKEFWSKNKKLGRPMSPHLTIYKPQLTSMLSITHRGTGLAQSGYLSIVGIGSLFLPGTPAHTISFVKLTLTINVCLFSTHLIAAIFQVTSPPSWRR